jgi:transcription initiation factor IIF auxiliary subunit
MMIAESYLSHQFDMDDDGDFDTVSYTANQLCKKPASEKRYKISGGHCNLVGEMIFFRNDDGKFTVSDRHEIDPGATMLLHDYDINKDGHMDLYAFRDNYVSDNPINRHKCSPQFKNIFFGNGDGTFRRPSVEEQSEIFGNYGCEIQSYFFDFEGESYRAFFTYKYSKILSGGKEVYVGVEKIATKAEKAKRIDEEATEEEAKAAEEDLIEKELAEFEAELEAEAEDAEAKRKAKIEASKAKVAAAKAKRIAEEAAKAAETDTVDTEQSVEDEIAAFEAELAAELGQ